MDSAFGQVNCLKSTKENASQVVLAIKNLPANSGDVKDKGSIPEQGRSPGEGNGKPLQYSCIENPMDRGAYWAIVHRVTKSRTRLKQLHMHACTHTHTHTHTKRTVCPEEQKGFSVISYSSSGPYHLQPVNWVPPSICYSMPNLS